MRLQLWDLKKHWLPFLILFCLGVACGYLLVSFLPNRAFKNTITRLGGYEYINPLLTCDVAEDAEYPKYANLKRELQTEADILIAKGSAARISVYFRDMNYGYWTGVRTDDTFIPASLMKVPILIAYLQDSQSNQSLMAKTLFLSNRTDANVSEIIQPPSPLPLGNTYTVKELLTAMIEKSDNNAMNTLNTHVSTTTLLNVYQQFGVNVIPDENSDAISPKNYMRFFRILYNASYIWRANSRMALEMLTNTEFKNGLVAGVAPSTPVAHKFGERTVKTIDATTKEIATKKAELHDCGIVYYPGSPYGICVMTEGTDIITLESVIADISRIAYTSVDKGLLKQSQ